MVNPCPPEKTLHHIVELARAILFPGYFGNPAINSRTINYHIGVNIEELFGLLTEQIQAGLCFGVENNGLDNNENEPCRESATRLAAQIHQPAAIHPTYIGHRCRSSLLWRSGSYLFR